MNPIPILGTLAGGHTVGLTGPGKQKPHFGKLSLPFWQTEFAKMYRRGAAAGTLASAQIPAPPADLL